MSSPFARITHILRKSERGVSGADGQTKRNQHRVDADGDAEGGRFTQPPLRTAPSRQPSASPQASTRFSVFRPPGHWVDADGDAEGGRSTNPPLRETPPTSTPSVAASVNPVFGISAFRPFRWTPTATPRVDAVQPHRSCRCRPRKPQASPQASTRFFVFRPFGLWVDADGDAEDGRSATPPLRQMPPPHKVPGAASAPSPALCCSSFIDCTGSSPDLGSTRNPAWHNAACRGSRRSCTNRQGGGGARPTRRGSAVVSPG